jgi:MFS family permease
MLMDQVGVVKGVRLGFILTIIGHVIMTMARGFFLRETLTDSDKETKRPNLQETFSGLFKLRGSILAMVIVTTLSSFSLRMVQPFLVVYAVNVINLTKTQWGTIQTIIGAISSTLSFPSGILSDRTSRRFSIILARSLHPFNRLILLLLRDFNQILLSHIIVGIGAGLGGEATGPLGAMGGPAWSALVADIVPSKDRGKVMGLMSMVTGIASMPASILGGYLWTNFSPDTLLIFTFFAGMVPVIIFYFFVKEPKVREQ